MLAWIKYIQTSFNLNYLTGLNFLVSLKTFLVRIFHISKQRNKIQFSASSLILFAIFVPASFTDIPETAKGVKIKANI